MELTSIAKDFIGLQKLAVNNFFEAMVIFQDQAESANRSIANQIGISDEGKEYIEQWRAIFKEGRDESRKLINESLTSMEDYFATSGSNKPSEKKKKKTASKP
jgi:DNA-binding PadR family transcriptional regulator